ncbi:DUF1127 domain-containing protein [Paenirhodobacter sp.]|uniref:DUF1127 domain-containing protein n=1 Tax=Paenirhodobacter sp. TaxID=1965326 RepID=UPI003B3DF88E
MAAFDTNRTVAAHSSVFGRFFDAIAAWNEMRITRNALARLSDHELADIGLTRYEAETLGR